MKKRIILPTVLAVSILFIGILAATKVSAEDSSYYPPIVQKIAEHFNLNVGDVQKVFDEERDERRADKYAFFAERLNDLVSEGKLTEAQKEAILDKHEEMQDKNEEWRNLSFEERKNKMQETREEFKEWAEEQGINLPLLGPFGKGFVKGFYRGYMMGTN